MPKKENVRGVKHISITGNIYYSYKQRKGIKKISTNGNVYYVYKRKKGKKKISKNGIEYYAYKKRKVRCDKRRKHKKPIKSVRKDGTIYKRMYRRKRGPRKTRCDKGIKKKNTIIQQPKPFYPTYKIILCSNKNQKKILGKFKTLIECMDKKNELLAESDNVIFPQLSTNNGRNSFNIYESNFEIVILEELETPEISETYLPNEFGKSVPFNTSNEKWKIFDKSPIKIEETIWVYGYNNKTDRKTFMWIYDNLFNENPNLKWSDFIRIYRFKNKILIKYDYKDFDMVILKDESDAIRFYNLMNIKCSKNKKIIFSGSIQPQTQFADETITLIQQKTGWKRIYARQGSTRR